jgi:hypothetical protein
LKVGGRGLMTASVTVTVYIVAADVMLAMPLMVLSLAVTVVKPPSVTRWVSKAPENR